MRQTCHRRLICPALPVLFVSPLVYLVIAAFWRNVAESKNAKQSQQRLGDCFAASFDYSPPKTRASAQDASRNDGFTPLERPAYPSSWPTWPVHPYSHTATGPTCAAWYWAPGTDRTNRACFASVGVGHEDSLSLDMASSSVSVAATHLRDITKRAARVLGGSCVCQISGNVSLLCPHGLPNRCLPLDNDNAKEHGNKGQDQGQVGTHS